MSITLTDKKIDTSGAGSVTYNAGGNPSIGAANSNRVIVIALSAAVVGGLTSCIVNGNAATIIGSRFSNACAAMWYITDSAAGTSGLTSCSVQINYSSTPGRSEIGVYSVITSTPGQTPATQNAANFSSSASISAPALTIPSDGGAIAVMGADENTTLSTTSWTGFTADYDDDIGGVSTTRGSAVHTTSTFGSTTFTANFSPNTNQNFLVAAAWSGTQNTAILMSQIMM